MRFSGLCLSALLLSETLSHSLLADVLSLCSGEKAPGSPKPIASRNRMRIVFLTAFSVLSHESSLVDPNYPYIQLRNLSLIPGKLLTTKWQARVAYPPHG